MAESVEHLTERLGAATQPAFREQLLDKGLARGMIWRDGVLPSGSPAFPDSLTEDLLDYAHTVLNMALRLRAQNVEANLERPFLVAGEAIEAAVHRGADGYHAGFHRVSAAVAFHLARYSARAYSMLPTGTSETNLAPTESALVKLVRRRLDELHHIYASWLLDVEHSDNRIAERLREDEEFDAADACGEVIVSAFMRAMALFDHAITTGESGSALAAKQLLQLAAESARDMHSVMHWWTTTLALHLIDELWGLSLHQQVPLLPPDHSDAERWSKLRRNYIQRLRAGKRSAIELWPSQLEAVRRAVNPVDDLVVALPTSAGKTRIAELCILRTLASSNRVVYVTPLRALSAQVERDLAGTFAPLGFSVSSLYGSAGIERGDAETLREGKIVVSTPEKLDFALRSDKSIIADVGLIVLDEGHMLGPNEREVRYEALVQRLLRRDDAGGRRIVCLSALFPSPEQMRDLVAWIRQDDPGDPIYSKWRPTRQRFGVLRWISNAARLDVKVEDERPFVPRFIETSEPPKGSRRRKSFPSDKNELTLASGWRFVGQEKDVLIYCSTRKSVETLGRLILRCIKHKVLESLGVPNERIRNAIATGVEWLGKGHPAVQCLEHGVALHHGGLPRPFLTEVERLLRSGDCRLTVASPTLAQGLNLSASVLLVPSIWRNREIIPTAEFANVAGRAGRAFVDVEGLVLHVVWEETAAKANQVIRRWEKLVDEAKAPLVQSGILKLSLNIFARVAEVAGCPVEELVEYVLGNSRAWDFSDAAAQKLDIGAIEWDRDLASLDASILALLDASTEYSQLATSLDQALSGSLFTRQVEQHQEAEYRLISGFVTARAARIWAHTTEPQRRGYHSAGIGLTAGQFLDANLQRLIELLGNVEAAISDSNVDDASSAAVAFAELVFQTAPFRAPKVLPAKWTQALEAWMRGKPSSQVIGICDDDGIDLLQEALTYRLPWAMEAVRVHANAVSFEGSEAITGIAAQAVEAGSCDKSVIVLLRAGLNSREAAFVAVSSSGAVFEDLAGLEVWMRSDVIQKLHADKAWPTPQSRHAWLDFYEGKINGVDRSWSRERQVVRVKWDVQAPDIGQHVVVEPVDEGWLVLGPTFDPLGSLVKALNRPRRDVVRATVGAKPNTVDIEFFGPK
jgi:superfamily II DNA/RNA helicase